jgi:DSF synthase
MLYGYTPRPQFQLEPVSYAAEPAPALDIRRGSLRTEYDAPRRALWMRMAPNPRPCFTPELLTDILAVQSTIRQAESRVDFVVLASDVPGVFNLGGDLSLFHRLASARDSAGLTDYAERCVQCLHNAISGFGAGITSIALIEGDALGGGFEAALSSHIVVAERGTKLGFPEIMFNLFPGMGAFSLVARRAGPQVAERLIMGGEILSAEQMHELGLVDHLAEKGEGAALVRKLIRERGRVANGLRAFRRACLHTPFAVPYEELLEVTKEWVRAACMLDARDLRVMERLVKAQNKLVADLDECSEAEMALAA